MRSRELSTSSITVFCARLRCRVLIGNRNGLRTRKNWLQMVLPLTHPAENFMFCFDRFRGRELAPGNALRSLYDLKFPRGQASVKIGANLGVRDLAHPATEAVADQRPLIHDRLALEVLVAGKGKRFSNPVQRVDGLLLMLRPFTCCTDNSVGLVPKGSCQLPVCGHYLRRRMDLFAVASRVRRDLGSFFSGAACAFEVFTNLLAARTGCVEVFLGVALDLRSAASPCCNLVPQLAHSVGQLGLIDGRGKLLRGKEAVRLDRARLAVVAFGDVENHRMGVQLWRDIAVDRASGIVLKLGSDKLARSLGRMIAADAGLCVTFELVESNANALPMCFANALVSADKRGERDRFRSGKGGIPPGPVLHRFDGLALSILIFIRRSLAHHLLARLWMLALAEFREVLGRDHPGKSELPGQPPLPFARDDAALRPIVLLFRGELLLVVGLCLASGERLGNGQHCS